MLLILKCDFNKNKLCKLCTKQILYKRQRVVPLAYKSTNKCPEVCPVFGFYTMCQLSEN